MNNVLFTTKEKRFVIVPRSFEYGVTIPVNEVRAEHKDINGWEAITVSEILSQSQNIKDEQRHKKFYEIVECMQTMNTFHDLLHLYIMGSSHVSKPQIDLTDEVKAIETLKIWIKFANKLHKLISCEKRLTLSDDIILKVARETKPTTFQMEDENAKYYDDTKSVITFLSPYEDNTRNLEKHKLSKYCVKGKNRISKFLKDPNSFKPFKVGNY